MTNNIIAELAVENKIKAFELWLNLTKALHNLTDTEIKVLAAFLLKRHELTFKINDTELLNETLFSPRIRKEIESGLKLDKDTTFQNTINLLRKKGVINGNQIKQGFIPSLSKDFNNFTLIFNVKVFDNK